MANWKVSAEKIEIFPHPNAETLDIAKVGMFSLVVGKTNNYKTGDIVIFAPKRSILPEEIRGEYTNTETGKSYLRGDDHSRVSSIRLRGELSEGVTLNREWVITKLSVASLSDIELGRDLSSELGITEYVAPIPTNFGGELAHLSITHYVQHDVEQMAIYGREFTPGEPVYATEKMHGSQCALIIDENKVAHVSSKGFLAKGIEIVEEEPPVSNLYWRAVYNTGLIIKLNGLYPNAKQIQAFGEVLPAQGAAWSYGQDPQKPTIRLFRLNVDSVEVAYDDLDVSLKELWAPMVFVGPFDLDVLRPLAKGREMVSGKLLHKREGIVVTPMTPRRSREGFHLALKIVSPDFKGSDDDPS